MFAKLNCFLPDKTVCCVALFKAQSSEKEFAFERKK